MKKSLIIAALAVMGGGVGSVAQAADTAPEQGVYLGGIYSFVSYKEDGLDTISPKTLAIQAGYNFNKNIALEGRIGFSAGSDTIQGIDAKIDSYYSILFRGTLPVNDAFNVYALAGHTNGKGKVGVSDTSSDSGFSYGIGAEARFAGHSAISLEWSRLLSGAHYDADALSVGYRYRF